MRGGRAAGGREAAGADRPELRVELLETRQGEDVFLLEARGGLGGPQQLHRHDVAEHRGVEEKVFEDRLAPRDSGVSLGLVRGLEQIARVAARGLRKCDHERAHAVRLVRPERADARRAVGEPDLSKGRDVSN
jgi:hypothetical protein